MTRCTAAGEGEVLVGIIDEFILGCVDVVLTVDSGDVRRGETVLFSVGTVRAGDVLYPIDARSSGSEDMRGVPERSEQDTLMAMSVDLMQESQRRGQILRKMLVDPPRESFDLTEVSAEEEESEPE